MEFINNNPPKNNPFTNHFGGSSPQLIPMFHFNSLSASLNFGIRYKFQRSYNDKERLPILENLLIPSEYNLPKQSPIIDTIKKYDNICSIINNKYVNIDELKTFIMKTELLLDIAKKTMEYLKSTPQLGLEIIFPVIEHLKLFLTDADMGTIALVSKTLYNLMVSNYGQLNIEIFIAKHYIDNVAYNYNIYKEFYVPRRYGDGFRNDSVVRFGRNNNIISEETTIVMPLHIKLIALKKLRQLLGPELYFVEHKIIFFKSDIIHLHKHKYALDEQMGVCVFCGINKKCDCVSSYISDHEFKLKFKDHIKTLQDDSEFKKYIHDKSVSFLNNNECALCGENMEGVCKVNYDELPGDGIIGCKSLYEAKYSCFLNSKDTNKFARFNIDKEICDYTFCINPQLDYAIAHNLRDINI